MKFFRKFLNQIMILKHQRFKYSNQKLIHEKKILDDAHFIRNIGILAHIDAGKTTTTERMLFFSGSITHMGEVHHGNTVTDFMAQERERGITITSAFVTLNWGKHKINLLDTPGHIDFTMEVEQTLNVMDGAVVILDATAGVEAQTITVWKQADRYNVPRVIYVNKMDRPTAEFFRCRDSIIQNFKVTPLVIQIPVYDNSKNFKGVVDLLNLVKYEWDSSSFNFTQTQLNPQNGKLWENSVQARKNLVEVLADLDDSIAEKIIMDEKQLEMLSSSVLRDSIQKITIEQKGFPIVCGSSYKNIGVQCLMDTIVNYLPSPLSSKSKDLINYFEKSMTAKAFKVRHDHYKGPITFLRIYSGELFKGQKMYNARTKKTENCEKLFVAYADDYNEVQKIKMGNIAAVTGLKDTVTGDFITSSSSVYSSLKDTLKGNEKENVINCLTSGRMVPDPVFFCSVEAPSPSYETALDKALKELEKEDPSLKITTNNETKQTKKSLVSIDKSPECIENTSKIYPRQFGAIKAGVEIALTYGPKLFYPVINTKAKIHFLEIGRGTPDTLITSATIKCIKKLLQNSGTKLLEPIMLVEIITPESTVDAIFNDLGKRRADIYSPESRDLDIIIRALVPLSELLGYAKNLRIITSGKGAFTMELKYYKEMDPEEEAKAVKYVTGF
ncbi:elongation factor G 2, putative [Pediculus humanus corporis]|uniref:Elongation factor G 2, putative n=1 Tax=Pediculus humanus subsp. corporis TaxID=121224 RepID=E0VMR4_PEDHC|nr:elongation factor G 2, putative [Pediculus humanus corporis]EEB14670.1 elongation factor G 2, putative [Pediculus humanus corporis]